MDFLSGQMLINTSKKYEEIYKHLNSEFGIKYHELFILCASLGMFFGKKEILNENGRELRSNYLNRSQKATAYSIILSDPEIGRQLSSFENKEFINQARKTLEQYAEAGMSILVKEVFYSKWNGFELETRYREYDIDIINYFYGKGIEIPF